MTVPFISGLAKLTGSYGEQSEAIAAKRRQEALDAQNAERSGIQNLLSQAQVENYKSQAQDRLSDNALQATTRTEQAAELARKIAQRKAVDDARRTFLKEKKGLSDAEAESYLGAENDKSFAELVKPTTDKQEAPVQRNTAKGIEQWNRETKKWELQTDAQGKPLMPYAAPVAQTPKYQLVKDEGTGKYVRVRVDGPEGPVDATFGKSGPGGVSAMAQATQARLLAAVAEAQAADERMSKYEDAMLKDPSKATPGLFTQMAGKAATRLAGTHSLSGIAAETAGENIADPDYLQYVRDAGLMARATQLMSSRGGSEAMVSAEQLLNRAVPNAKGLEGSVNAARQSRKAIFGPVGGLAQALTPDQLAKVNKGLEALHGGDRTFNYGDIGPIIEQARGSSGASTSTTQTRRSGDARPPIAQRVQELRAQGVSRDDAKKQLKAEGYQIPE